MVSFYLHKVNRYKGFEPTFMHCEQKYLFAIYIFTMDNLCVILCLYNSIFIFDIAFHLINISVRVSLLGGFYIAIYKLYFF